jgi:light-regulated signal transduction histidine kinase (bacteriophytochrome)
VCWEKAMQALQKNVEAEAPTLSAAERELKDFSYLVAHDLACEFRHVAEFSRLLAGEVNGEPARAHAEIIRQSASRCQRMLGALMVYSSVQTQELARRAWPGKSVVERALVELGQREAARAAHIEVDVTGEVFADARLLILAIRLALANALDAAREGIDLSIVIRGANDRDGSWVLEIADNGEGLAREYRERAFAMFWRLDPATAGIGAGLPTLRRIVRRHNGEARFLEAGVGAHLEITIPGAGAGQ